MRVSYTFGLRLYFGLVVLLELLKFTPLIGAFQGRVGPWSVVINILLGLDAAASYARIDRQPSKSKVTNCFFASFVKTKKDGSNLISAAGVFMTWT